MGGFNLFAATADPCPHCGDVCEAELEAYLGLLEMRRFRPGDVVRPPREARGTVAPEPRVWEAGRPFWVAGLGECACCGGLLRARIHVRDGRYRRAEAAPALESPDEWGYD